MIVLRRVNEAGRRACAGHNSRRRAGYGTRSRVLGRTSTPKPFLEGGEPATTERSGSPRWGERYSCGTAPALHRLPSVWSYNSGLPSHGRWPRDDLASMAIFLPVGQTPVLADQEVPPCNCPHPTGTGASDQRPTPGHVETRSVCPDRWQSRGCGGHRTDGAAAGCGYGCCVGYGGRGVMHLRRGSVPPFGRAGRTGFGVGDARAGCGDRSSAAMTQPRGVARRAAAWILVRRCRDRMAAAAGRSHASPRRSRPASCDHGCAQTVAVFRSAR